MTDQTISHYRIVSELGKGGMGVVYRAKDTKLNRTVALKLLAPHMLASEADRARFYREARAAAALHHPNIATVFEIDETEDGRPFIAMEFIEGRQLDEGLSDKPLPVERAVAIASQIAEALKAAHERGIVHRDIKSANVMLTKEGTAKVLDFGLAKTDASTKLTQMGSTVGTIAYMSPEQARGEEVDHRTDLWSLGAVLYEMLTGQLPFPGSYEQAVVYGILNGEPEPVTGLRSGVPMELERITGKLLTKEAEYRYQSASGLLADLNSLDMAARSLSPHSVAATATPRWVWLGMAMTLMAGALVAWLAKTPSAADPHATVGFSIETEQPALTGRRSIAITPDGTIMALVTADGLELRQMHNLSEHDSRSWLPRLREVFASPDSEWLGFENVNDQVLMRVRVAGGAPVPVTPLPGGLYGTHWNEDGYIYMGLGPLGMGRVSPNGGPIEALGPDSLHGFFYRAPQLLPDGKTLLFTRRRPNESWNFAEIRLLNLDTNQQRLLHAGGTDARYLDSGHIVFARDNALQAFAFDPGDGERLSEHFAVGGPVHVQGGTAQFAISSDGTMLKIPPTGGDRQVQLAWLDPDGSVKLVSPEPDWYLGPAVHPNGRQIAYSSQGELWLLDSVRNTQDLLSSSGWSPTWSPDGNLLAFAEGGIVTMRPTVSLELEILVPRTSETAAPISWSADGRYLVFNQWSRDGARISVDLLDLDERTTTRFLEDARNAVISPGGAWIAYESDESGTFEVYVRRFPGGEQRLVVSNGGGTAPEWRPDGGAIYFYIDERQALALAEFDAGTGEIGPARVLTDETVAIAPGYSMSPLDVRPLVRVLPEESGQASSRHELEVVVHWTEHLRSVTPDR